MNAIGVIDLLIHKAIDADQFVTLSADILKEKLNSGFDKLKIQDAVETIESISSSGMQTGEILHEARKKLKEILLKMS